MSKARSGVWEGELPTALELLDWADRLLEDVQCGNPSENSAIRWQHEYIRYLQFNFGGTP